MEVDLPRLARHSEGDIILYRVRANLRTTLSGAGSSLLQISRNSATPGIRDKLSAEPQNIPAALPN